MQGETQADDRLVRPTIEAVLEEKCSGPPQATVKRRAQSYSDFHHAVTTVLGMDERRRRHNSTTHSPKYDEKTRQNLEHAVQDDLDFADLYSELEPSLLESSYDEYTYVFNPM